MLQEDQKREISRLESEVATMKEKHTERTQALKAEFLHSQTKFEKEERARVGVLQRQANAVSTLWSFALGFLPSVPFSVFSAGSIPWW